MIWFCKVCGRYQDDMFNEDGICEDCFDKMNKKNKHRIRAALLRFVSVLSAVAVMLCVFTAALPVGAAANSNVCTYKDYPSIKLTLGSTISAMSLYDMHQQFYPEYNQVLYYLISFDDSGSVHYYSCSRTDSTVGRGYFSSVSCCYTFASWGAYLYDGNNLSDSQMRSNKSYFYLDNYNDKSCLVQRLGDYLHPAQYLRCDGADFDLSADTTFYFVMVPYDADNGLIGDYYKQLLIDNGTAEDLEGDDAPEAEILTFQEYSDGTSLYLADWISMGQQYPVIDFCVDDKGNKHNYALRISANQNYIDQCMALWQESQVRDTLSAVGNGIAALSVGKAILGVGKVAMTHVASFAFPVGLIFANVPVDNDNVISALRLLQQYRFLESLQSYQYDVVRNITDPVMNFTDDGINAKAFSVCLVDYMSVIEGLLYKIEIVDTTTGIVLDTAFFSNNRSYERTNSGYGTKTYEYSSSDDLYNDIDSGGGYNGADNSFTGGNWTTDNPNDIVDFKDYALYDISSITGTLSSATAQLGDFFQACFNIIPGAVMTIVLGSLSLIVVLRILGR